MQGSCYCGATSFDVQGRPLKIVNCHCTLCRKMNGAAFSTYVVVSQKQVRFVQQTLKTVAVGKQAHRTCCSECASPLYNTNPHLQDVYIFYLGAIDSELDDVPQLNIYSHSRLSWVETLPQIPSLAAGIA